VNQVSLVGNITDDPELRHTQSGAALAGFTVAVSHRSKHNSEWQDVTDGFFRCTAWRSVAENASRTLRKGMRVFVAGKLLRLAWQEDTGNKRRSVEIQVRQVGPDLYFATVSAPFPGPPLSSRLGFSRVSNNPSESIPPCAMAITSLTLGLMQGGLGKKV
jgi:single-strand DNA-binding protein